MRQLTCHVTALSSVRKETLSEPGRPFITENLFVGTLCCPAALLKSRPATGRDRRANIGRRAGLSFTVSVHDQLTARNNRLFAVRAMPVVDSYTREGMHGDVECLSFTQREERGRGHGESHGVGAV